MIYTKFPVLFLLWSSFAFAEIVRYINPPNLTRSHLGEQITCYRPLREGNPRMEVEELGSKTVVHNYGHGGSGWTLAPGSSKYVIEQLHRAHPTLPKTEPIAIVGAGAIGLFTAAELIQQGYEHITIYAKEFEKLTSHNAGGLLAPVSMHTSPEMQATLDQIGIDAYRFYKKVALQSSDSWLKKGARILPAYFSDRENSGLEPYVKAGVMGEAKDVILDFKNGTRRPMVAYDDGIFMDTPGLMLVLREYLQAQKVSIIQKEVSNFYELSERLIFNCTGLGAKTLVKDQDVKPVQGHLVYLTLQDSRDLEYMLLTNGEVTQKENGFQVKRSFYIFPKILPGSLAGDVGVIGGTFIEGAGPDTPHSEEFEHLITGAKEFYGIR